MTIKLIDAAFETTTTTGSGSYTLAGAQTGHQSFAVAGNGAKVLYQVNDGNASGVITQREVGIGTITISGGVTTLSRDSILYSTNSNSAINWGAGTKNVLGSIPAAALLVRDENLNFVEGFGTIAGTANALTMTLPNTPLGYSDGMQIAGYIAATNTMAGTTIAVNGLSVKALKYKGADPGIGNLPIGQLLVARYSAANGWFELVSPVPTPSIPAQIYFGRNLLMNAMFTVNQRGYVSGTNTTAANQYTIDRWRVVTSGQNLVTTSFGQITAPAGGVEQVVEGASILAGDYVINWSGTATATVNGTAIAKGATVTLPANTNATVRFLGGTVSKPQLELGSTASTFEMRPYAQELSNCQRYFEICNSHAVTYSSSGVNVQRTTIFFKMTKRSSTPAITTISQSGTATLVASPSSVSANHVCHGLTAGNASQEIQYSISADAEL